MRPVFVGTTQIMNFYDSVNPDGIYAYSLWFGDKIMLQYPGNGDEEKARDFLENCMKLYDENGWDKTLWLKFHEPQKTLINRKTDVMISQPIGFMADADETAISGSSAMTTRGYHSGNMELYRAIKTIEELPVTLNKTIEDKFTAYEQRIKLLEAEKEKEPDTWDKISGFVEKNPNIVETIFGFLNGSRRFTQTPPAPVGINGAPQTMETTPQEQQQPAADQERVIDNEKVDNALDRLNNVMILDEDLTLLADYAEANPDMFQILLNNLRQQKK